MQALVCCGSEDAETAAMDPGPGLLIHCCCLAFPVVLVNLTTLERVVSKGTWGCPQMTF